MDSREEWLARTVVELADTLVADFDLIDFLSGLVERCVELLDTAEVGLVLVDIHGRLQVMASSTERMRVAELFEVQNEEGPCLDCHRTGEQVLNQDLEDAEGRWPRFAPMARHAGFRMVHALPMRLRSDVIGAVNIFDAESHPLTSLETNLAQALADVATIGIIQERTVKLQADLSSQLQGALNSRIAIEQAKGVVAERENVDMEQAFSVLRTYARSNHRQLTDVARAVIDRTLTTSELGLTEVSATERRRVKRSP